MNAAEAEVPVLAVPVHPWRTMWLHPRATIRAIVESANPTQSIYRLAILVGLYQSLSGNTSPALLFLYMNFGFTGDLFIHLAVALVSGVLFGLIGIGLSGVVFGAMGRRFGGVATNDETRAALVWASMPIIVVGVPLALLLVVLGYSGTTVTMVATMLTIGAYLLNGLMLWTLVLTVAALAEVNRFSIGRAITIVMIPILIIVLVVGIMLFR